MRSRFSKELSNEALNYLVKEDVEYDERLIEHDILGSEAHTIMLMKTGILSQDESRMILMELEKLRHLHLKGKLKLDPNLEDVHMNIEALVSTSVGLKTGGKMHTARSRNDQVVLDVRLYLRQSLNEISRLLCDLIEVLLDLASRHIETVMPGFTHFQHAQPITFAHWLQAYVAVMLRNLERIHDIYRRIDFNPLGACALAGTSWPIDRHLTTKLLGFQNIQLHSLDVVTSRGEDVCEVVAIFAFIMIPLSRLSEDLIIWSTAEFSMIEIDDAYATSSSIMPQKKNPDVAELIRAKASETIGMLTSSLAILKGLPTGYAKDTQLTKHIVIRATDAVKASLQVVKGMISTLHVNVEKMKELAGADYATATDMADCLARETSLSFRESHRAIASVIKYCSDNKLELNQLDSTVLSDLIFKSTGAKVKISKKKLLRLAEPLESVKARVSLGSPAPKQVKKMQKQFHSQLRQARILFSTREKRVETALQRTMSLIHVITSEKPHEKR